MKKPLLLPILLLTAALPALAYHGGTRVRTFTAGPYFSGPAGLGLQVTRCVSQIHEDCFFWTPPGCDGVTEYPIFTLTSVNSYSFCADAFSCGYNTYCSGSCSAQCDIIGPERPPIDNCPIVIPLDSDRRVRFTDLARGVPFDIDADGEKELISWTDPRSSTVFLALDRDGDGAVTDGSERFGNQTDQRPSSEPNGFIALARFDRPAAGGNGDGSISAADAVFDSLLLWNDANHDGQSQPEELQSLAKGGVVEMELRYSDTPSYDRFGPYLKYRAGVKLINGQTRAVDVFFRSE